MSSVNMSPKRAWQVSSSHCALRNQITLWTDPGRRGPGGSGIVSFRIPFGMLALLASDGRILQAVVPPEELSANRDCRHADYAACVRGVCGGAQRQLDLGLAGRPRDSLAIQAGLLGRQQHVLLDPKIMAMRASVAKGRDRELASAPNLEGIGGRAHRV